MTTATRKPTRTAKPKAADARRIERGVALLKQASDGTRLRVLLALADGEEHVGALCAAMGQSQPAVSHHLAILRHSGIITPRRQGKFNFYSLTEAGAELARAARGLMGRDG